MLDILFFNSLYYTMVCRKMEDQETEPEGSVNRIICRLTLAL